MTRPVRSLQRALAASGRGPLAPVWRAVYGGLARGAAWRASRSEGAATAYARGGLATGDLAPGVSDIDVVVVVDGDPDAPAAARLRVTARVPPSRLVHVAVYEQAELALAQRGPAPTFEGGSLFHGPLPHDDALWLRARPGLDGPATDWRRLRGPERRRPAAARDPQDLRVAAWLELQWWWRHAIEACVSGPAPHHRRLGAKLVAEAARIVLALEHGERPVTRRSVLERSLARLPQEERAITRALADLDRAGPAGLDQPLAAFARISERIAAHLAAVTPETELVQLVGTPATTPLLDWRSVVLADSPEEPLVVWPGHPGDPAAIAAAAGAGGLRALHSNGLLLFAAAEVWPATVFRTLQCPVTDPVSFALLGGQDVARFPAARGWSARAWAARAIAEHSARLASPPADATEAATLALTAARADGLAQGELALTLDVAAERLGWSEAAAWWRDGHGVPPPDGLAPVLVGAARALETYTRACE